MEKTKKCPYCCEDIPADSTKCSYCGERQPDGTNFKKNNEKETINEDIPNQTDSLFKSCFWEQVTKHYCDFHGAIDRKTYWVCYLYYTLIMVLMSGISAVAPILGMILNWIVLLALLLPFMSLSIRRLNDIGKKWPLLFIVLIPIVGPIWLLVLMLKKGGTKNHNIWTTKDTVITIAMGLTALFLYVIAGFTTDSENVIKAEIEKQVVEDYKTQEIYNHTTADFDAAVDAAIAAEDYSGYLCMDGDFFYMTQSDVDLEQLKVSTRVELVNKTHARVYVTLEYDYSSFSNYSSESLLLLMEKDKKTEKWLVDDISDVENQYSAKESLRECAKDLLEMTN